MFLELLNPVLLLLQFRLECVDILSTRLELGNTFRCLLEFLLKLKLLLPDFLGVSILVPFQVLKFIELRIKPSNFVLSLLERTLEGSDSRLQRIPFCGEASELGRRCC